MAEGVTAETRAGEPFKIGIGLRGSVLYGAMAFGARGEAPVTKTGFSVSKKNFLPFFRPRGPEITATPTIAASPALAH